jgi:hypothetical protein
VKKFIIYDDDGNILSQLQCLESEIADNLPNGCSYQEFDGDPLNKKLVDGELIDLEIEPFVLAVPLRDTRNALLNQSDWTTITRLAIDRFRQNSMASVSSRVARPARNLLRCDPYGSGRFPKSTELS